MYLEEKKSIYLHKVKIDFKCAHLNIGWGQWTSLILNWLSIESLVSLYTPSLNVNLGPKGHHRVWKEDLVNMGFAHTRMLAHARLD